MQNKYKGITFGTAEAVFNKLGGQEGIEKFLRGETKIVSQFVSEVHPWYFKTITIGDYDSVQKIGAELIKRNFVFSDQCQVVMSNIEVSKEKKEIKLFVTTIKELTGKNKANYIEVVDAVISKGYKLCPAEVGPQLRLQYDDQTYNDWLRILMEPISLWGKGKKIFALSHTRKSDTNHWNVNIDAQPTRALFGAHRVVFCK